MSSKMEPAMRIKPAFLALAALLVTGPLATAHNNYFLPGDAFFSVSLTREVMKRWAENKSDTFVFEYTRFDDSFMACGNIGYTKLKVTGIDDTFRQALLEAYWLQNRDITPVDRVLFGDPDNRFQSNGVVALFYNRDFKGTLGLKYNEDWPEQGAGVYGGYFKTARPVQDDWQNGPRVAPLKIEPPLDPLTHLGPPTRDGKPNPEHSTMNEPITIAAKDLMVALVGLTESNMTMVQQHSPDLQRIYDGEDHAHYLTVTAEAIIDHLYVPEKGWEETTHQLPLPAGKSRIPGPEDKLPETKVEHLP